MSRSWGLLLSSVVGTHGVVVGNVGAQEPVEMSLVQDEEMVEALAADGADHSLHEGILPGCARGGEDLADVHALDSSRELLAIDRVSITEQEPVNRIVRERLDKLRWLLVQAAWCILRRRKRLETVALRDWADRIAGRRDVPGRDCL
jgi:hypothetical protein